MPPSPTQQQFDLSSFRKEVEQQRRQSEENKNGAARRGWDEDRDTSTGWVEALDWVLALLPGEEDGEQEGVNHNCEVCELATELAEARTELQDRDSCLERLLGWVEKQRSSCKPGSADEAAVAYSLVARRIHELQGERGEGK